jgi:hypothetical protein
VLPQDSKVPTVNGVTAGAHPTVSAGKGRVYDYFVSFGQVLHTGTHRVNHPGSVSTKNVREARRGWKSMGYPYIKMVKSNDPRPDPHFALSRLGIGNLVKRQCLRTGQIM